MILVFKHWLQHSELPDCTNSGGGGGGTPTTRFSATTGAGVQPGGSIATPTGGVQPGVSPTTAGAGVQPGGSIATPTCGVQPGVSPTTAGAGVQPGGSTTATATAAATATAVSAHIKQDIEIATLILLCLLYGIGEVMQLDLAQLQRVLVFFKDLHMPCRQMMMVYEVVTTLHNLSILVARNMLFDTTAISSRAIRANYLFCCGSNNSGGGSSSGGSSSGGGSGTTDRVRSAVSAYYSKPKRCQRRLIRLIVRSFCPTDDCINEWVDEVAALCKTRNSIMEMNASLVICQKLNTEDLPQLSDVESLLQARMQDSAAKEVRSYSPCSVQWPDALNNLTDVRDIMKVNMGFMDDQQRSTYLQHAVEVNTTGLLQQLTTISTVPGPYTMRVLVQSKPLRQLLLQLVLVVHLTSYVYALVSIAIGCTSTV